MLSTVAWYEVVARGWAQAWAKVIIGRCWQGSILEHLLCLYAWISTYQHNEDNGYVLAHLAIDTARRKTGPHSSLSHKVLRTGGVKTHQ